MQIKEFEAYSLKDCLQQVRKDLGPEAVILETRKFRKGGLFGMGARDAVCIVAATGITVKNDTLPPPSAPPSTNRMNDSAPPARSGHGNGTGKKTTEPEPITRVTPAVSVSQAAAVVAARNAYTRHGSTPVASERLRSAAPTAVLDEPPVEKNGSDYRSAKPQDFPPSRQAASKEDQSAAPVRDKETQRIALLEHAMQEIRDSLLALKQEQEDAHTRTVTAVVSAVAPAVHAVHSVVGLAGRDDSPTARLPELYERLRGSGISDQLACEMMDSLPDLSAWSEEAQMPLAESALRDFLSRRINCAGPICLTPGQLKAIALIGPTGVGKTTTIAKLAAHFSLVEHKKVALLTVDTYRIAAVEQLKTYSQIIDIPIGVAYNQAEVLPAVEQFADYDLLLIDTAGRSQKNIMQVGELKAMLETVRCETHLVLSALIKTEDMLEAARRFSAARVDRLLFSKLDETGTYGTLFEVADKTGIPLSYLTTGQKVPEDIETADPATLADLILN